MGAFYFSSVDASKLIQGICGGRSVLILAGPGNVWLTVARRRSQRSCSFDDSGEGLGLILFDEEEQARRASLPELWQAPGVTVKSVNVSRVAATA